MTNHKSVQKFMGFMGFDLCFCWELIEFQDFHRTLQGSYIPDRV